MSDELVETKPVALEKAEPPSVEELLQTAIERGLDPAGLTKLVELHERVMAKRAEKLFYESLQAFQSECPTIRKNKTANAGAYSYEYASLEYLSETIRPYMKRHGLSWTQDSRTAEGQMTVTTTIQHDAGHKELRSFTVPVAQTARMNEMQQAASALSYARRYSLMLSLGLTTGNEDDDGFAGGAVPLNENQIADIEALLEETKADRKRFLQFMGVKQVGEITSRDYKKAIRALEAKRAKG